MNINRRRQQGMSLLPVLGLSALLGGLLLSAAAFKTPGASQEDLTKSKLAATSAVNLAAAELRQFGSLPADKTINVEGIQVALHTVLSADGGFMKISADSRGEVVQATALRQIAALQTPGAAASADAGWVVYNGDNVVISKDSVNHKAMVIAENARLEAIRQAAAAAEAARVAEANRIAEAAAAAEAARAQAEAQAQAQADAAAASAAASKLASDISRDAMVPGVAPTGTIAEMLTRLQTLTGRIKSGELKLSGIYGMSPASPGGTFQLMSDQIRAITSW